MTWIHKFWARFFCIQFIQWLPVKKLSFFNALWSFIKYNKNCTLIFQLKILYVHCRVLLFEKKIFLLLSLLCDFKETLVYVKKRNWSKRPNKSSLQLMQKKKIVDQQRFVVVGFRSNNKQKLYFYICSWYSLLLKGC